MSKGKERPSNASIFGHLLGAAVINTGKAVGKCAGEAAKECMVGKKKSERKNVKETVGEGFWSIFTG